MLTGRTYKCKATSQSGLTAGNTDTHGLLVAGASNPLWIKAGLLKAKDNATSFMLDAALRRVTTVGSPVENVSASSSVVQVDTGGAAEAFTWYGELSTEPTTYASGDDDVVGRDSYPSITGWRIGGLDPILDGDGWVFLDGGDAVGLWIYTASFSATQFEVTLDVIEML